MRMYTYIRYIDVMYIEIDVHTQVYILWCTSMYNIHAIRWRCDDMMYFYRKQVHRSLTSHRHLSSNSQTEHVRNVGIVIILILNVISVIMIKAGGNVGRNNPPSPDRTGGAKTSQRRTTLPFPTLNHNLGTKSLMRMNNIIKMTPPGCTLMLTSGISIIITEIRNDEIVYPYYSVYT